LGVLGTIVNALAIIAGTLVGLIFRRGVPKRYIDGIMTAVSLAVILIGLKGALKSDDMLIVISSLVIGTVAGEFLQIEENLEKFGRWIGAKFSTGGDSIAKGFITASLVYCVGAMAIVGSLESGLTGNHQTLFAKSILDGIISIVFATSLGAGVMLSSLSVFIYQGIITLTASFMTQFLIPSVVSQMTSAGGLLIMCIGINMLEIKKIKVGNMLPAIFIPLLYFMIK